jgi:transketolase
VLSQYGFIPPEELPTYGAFQSRIGCHPDRFKVPGIELSTGSLGHGIAVAVGIALAFRIQNSPRRVFTLVGDGESNEGMVWESVMIAANLRLANLAILYDHNGSQRRSLPIPNPADRFRAFQCDTLEVDGHDLEALKAALARPADTVKVVVASAIKGYGCPTLADNMFEWHRKSPDPAQFELLMKELEAA